MAHNFSINRTNSIEQKLLKEHFILEKNVRDQLGQGYKYQELFWGFIQILMPRLGRAGNKWEADDYTTTFPKLCYILTVRK